MKKGATEIFVLSGEVGKLISTKTIVVKKSEFISLVYNVESKCQVDEILQNIKLDYKDAKHIVYAYMLKDGGKYTDDKEPQGTAGKPIYAFLEKEKLTNVLIVVVRFFGGVLLGTGPLMRAYLSVSKDAVNKLKKELYIEYEEKEIICNYKEESNVINMLKEKNAKIKEIVYEEMVKISALIPKKQD